VQAVAELDHAGAPAPVTISTSPGESHRTAPGNGADEVAEVANGSADGAVAGTVSDRATRRARRWDRPPPPKDWRWWVGGLGKVLIAAGLLLLGFVAYQLWGTGIETARAQRALENDFEEMLAAAPAVTAPPVPEPAVVPDDTTPDAPETTTAPDEAIDDPNERADEADGSSGTLTTPDASTGGTAAGFDGGVAAAVPLADQNIPELTHGDALARLQIPSIGVDDIVVAGVQPDDLKKGPGHFPETPLPGQLGNSAIAGHRTTYGQPFHNIDELQPGDDIIVTTLSGQYIYVVNGQSIVSPGDYHVVTTTDPSVSTLTLTSCHPKWTARERIVVSAQLDTARSSPVGEPLFGYDADDEAAVEETLPEESTPPTTPEVGTTVAATDEPTDDTADGTDSGSIDGGDEAPAAPVDDGQLEASHAEIADAFSDSWFSDPAAFVQVALWGAVLVMIWALGYLLSRRVHRYWVGIAATVLPFVVALYFFYQNVNRLLPPNL
jgi:sortase A